MYNIYNLDNGITVISEKISSFRSVSIGIWFRAGSAYENDDNNGISHLIEHMLFKGTTNRNAKQIASEIDAVGGVLNAFTSKECTCFYCKVMDEHLHTGIELLFDLLLNSTFDETELAKEKGIIAEEILMYDDSPEDLVHENLTSQFFNGHPLSLPILGTIEGLEKYNRNDLLDFYDRFYTPDNMVISVAGNFDESYLIDIIRKYTCKFSKQSAVHVLDKVTGYGSGIHYQYKDIEQMHLCMGFPGINIDNKYLYAFLILNNIFGGSMSSRLFQKIREDEGLTYSIYSYTSSYTCGGMFSIYAGMKPSYLFQVAELIVNEINSIRKEGVLVSEFKMAKEQLKGNYILGLESTNSRMSATGRSQLLLNRVMTQDQVIKQIEETTIEQVKQIIDFTFDPQYCTVALVGPEDKSSDIISSGLIDK